MKRRKIVAFCGNQGSGKDYSCSRLMMTMGFEKVAFADSLREIAFKTIGMSFEEGMKKYGELKVSKLFNNLTFRNILENLGSAVRSYDKDFWAKTALVKIKSSTKNICISDLRYPNEYKVLKDYCDLHGIEFKLVFCDYHSERYEENNPHESAALANYLKKLGYKDQQQVDIEDVLAFEGEN